MKKSARSVWAQCGAVFFLLTVLWVGSYVGLRRFCETKHYINWGSFSLNGAEFTQEITKVIEVPESLLPVTVVYKPFTFIEEKFTGERVGFVANQFKIGATANF